MKYCPKCNSRYDEEILRFCMKDGTPLLDAEEPKFIAMPSESIDGPDDDPSEVTVIRRNVPAPTPLPDNFDENSFAPNQPSSPRIVVPTSQVPPPNQQRPMPQYQSPQRSNTVIVVLLTMIGTLAVLGVGVLFFWFLQKDNGAANGNINTSGNFANVNTNVNNNLGFDFNANANLGSSSNTNSLSNVNANANVRTPTPTPKPSPSASPTPFSTPNDDDYDDDRPRPTPPRTPNPTPTPIIIRPGSTPQVPRMNPLPNRTPPGGVLNGQALRLSTPAYPQAAKLMKAGGEVRVQVSVDENGNITSARAVSGHPLLRQSAENAARQSKMRVSRTTGELVYNFRNN